jgi:DinB family
MATGLPDFFKFNLWANLRLLDACEQLSDAKLDATTKGVYGSVRETLMHLVSSEIATVLSQQGIEPPCLDAWCYNDALREKS